MTDRNEMVVTQDDVASAAYHVVNNDSVLQNSDHLNSVDNVFNNDVPRTDSLPRMLIAAGQIIVDPDSMWHSITLDCEARARNIDDGKVADTVLLSRLAKRVCFLLVGQGTMTRAGMRFYEVILDTLFPALPAPDTNKESTVLARLTVVCRAIET